MVEAAGSRLPQPLPIPRTHLIGREGEITAAHAFLIDEAVPLLTLTGPGGVGKTRLALAIADDIAACFADGLVWVDLAPLTDPALVAATLVASLGLASAREMTADDTLVHHLRLRQALLLIDNCEHALAETAAVVGALLPRCPALHVLVTSRAPLRVHGVAAPAGRAVALAGGWNVIGHLAGPK